MEGDSGILVTFISNFSICATAAGGLLCYPLYTLQPIVVLHTEQKSTLYAMVINKWPQVLQRKLQTQAGNILHPHMADLSGIKSFQLRAAQSHIYDELAHA